MTTCRSKRNAQERIVKLKELIERWDKGVSMLNQGKIAARNASARFNQLANEISLLTVGYEEVPEIEWLLSRWAINDHENPIEMQRTLLDEYYAKWGAFETALEKRGVFNPSWREGFDASILRAEGKETS